MSYRLSSLFSDVSLHSRYLFIIESNSITDENYDKNNLPFLKVDAQFTVVEAALKGYMKWVDHSQEPGMVGLCSLFILSAQG